LLGTTTRYHDFAPSTQTVLHHVTTISTTLEDIRWVRRCNLVLVEVSFVQRYT